MFMFRFEVERVHIQILQVMEVASITFEITTDKNETKTFQFDSKILAFNIEYVSNNHHEPYPIPNNVANTLRPFQMMKEFVIAHNYSSQNIKIVKPLNSANYADIVDPITFKLFSKFCDERNAEEATEVIKLAEFIRFHELSDAVSAAVATNYFIGEDQKALDEFIKKNALENITSEEISEIIKTYQDQFKMIELRAKEELLKIEAEIQ